LAITVAKDFIRVVYQYDGAMKALAAPRRSDSESAA
jgi:hypothetical protein